MVKSTIPEIRRLAANPPSNPRREYFDGEGEGFHLRRFPSGALTPRLRFTADGRTRFKKVGRKFGRAEIEAASAAERKIISCSLVSGPSFYRSPSARMLVIALLRILRHEVK